MACPLSTMSDNENIMFLEYRNMYHGWTMILILYLLRLSEPPWLYHGQSKLNMKQWLTKVIKPYYNHVETWLVKLNNLPNNVKQGKNMLEHDCTCYHGIIVHQESTTVLKPPYLTMIRLYVVLSWTEVVLGKTLVPFWVSVISLYIIIKV